MNGASRALLGLLTVAVVGSAIGVAYSKHNSRSLFIELQQLEAAGAALEVEWGQLQLEQSTLARHERVETLARQRLDMRAPATDTIVVLQLKP